MLEKRQERERETLYTNREWNERNYSWYAGLIPRSSNQW